MNRIKPEIDLANILPLVQTPGRYTGGEYGAEKKDLNGKLLTAICFPDLYEIGMSNTAIKLLYSQINSIEGVVCERVFSPAPDFESRIKEASIPLYTLESGIPLRSLDILGFSVGYELSATNILAVLETGGIENFRGNRSDNSPIIIGGGPALSNPAPFRDFFDAIYMGEAEYSYSMIVEAARDLKRQGAHREDLMEVLMGFDDVWMPDKKESAKRGVWKGFDTARAGKIPVPNISVVQDHAVIEIMRGCPNGCRFCHAGLYYRPFRQKSFEAIIREADFYVHELGYRKITLSSLSTGDYNQLHALVRNLNSRYTGLGVSFSLPSLRVNSVTLPLLQELSVVRKSGLTFAVETPRLDWQRSLNKEVPVERVIEILQEARQRGWNMAKFYFMIGLPEHLYEGEDEAQAIAEYLWEVRKKTGFKLNVNIGTFIPKPHTPYQWSRQLTEQSALEKIRFLKNEFNRTPVKISYHSPFISLMEGIISRGDNRVGELILSAYRAGARLDAWEEHLDYDIWRKVVEESSWDVLESTCRERKPDETLPWDTVDLGFTKKYLLSELEKSKNHVLTDQCSYPCTHHCGICSGGISPNIPENNGDFDRIFEKADTIQQDGSWFLFIFSKTGKARFLSHINVMTIFERSFQRAGIALQYSEGFNPKPRVEFAQPLSLGISSLCEAGRFKLKATDHEPEPLKIMESLNKRLPEGFCIDRIEPFTEKYSHGRGKSLMSLYAGSTYAITVNPANMKDDISLEKLYQDIERFISGIQGRLDWLKKEDNEIHLFVPAKGTVYYSLKNLFNEITEGIGPFLSRYNITRTELYMSEGTIEDPQKIMYENYLKLSLK